MTEKRRVLVTINDQEFTVVSTEPEDYVVELSRYVDENIRDTIKKSPKLSSNMAYILSAFNIADSYYKEREAHKEFREEVSEPLSSYEKCIEELEALRLEYEKLKSESEGMKDEIINSRRQIDKLTSRVEEQEQDIKIKNNEILNSETAIKELQDKMFKDQKELLELKSQLSDKK